MTLNVLPVSRQTCLLSAGFTACGSAFAQSGFQASNPRFQIVDLVVTGELFVAGFDHIRSAALAGLDQPLFTQHVQRAVDGVQRSLVLLLQLLLRGQKITRTQPASCDLSFPVGADLQVLGRRWRIPHCSRVNPLPVTSKSTD